MQNHQSMIKKLIFRHLAHSKFFAVLASLFLIAAQADGHALKFATKNCNSKEYQFSHNNLVFQNPGKNTAPRLYILHNISKSDIWVNKLTKGKGVSAGWASQLNSGHWSAIAISDAKSVFTCTDVKNPRQFTDCSQQLKVCAINNAKFPANLSGSFWVSENQADYDALTKAIKERKINF